MYYHTSYQLFKSVSSAQGLDNATSKTYEEELCKGSGQQGVVVIGDSVGAHFHAPEEWFSPPLLTLVSTSRYFLTPSFIRRCFTSTLGGRSP